MSNTIHNKYKNFIGVVEDINDPKELGRIRVRCIGYHTDSKRNVPTGRLPWAHVMMPITSPSLGGVGQSSTGVVQGSWVAGYFIDGDLANNPIVIGTLPSMSGNRGGEQIAFSDPDGIHPLKENSPDIPIEATSRYKEGESYKKRETNRSEGMGVAQVTGTYDMPQPAQVQGTKYPNNKATHTLSGHTIEIDDTPGKERLLIQHRSGSHVEMDAAGNVCEVNEGSGFKLVKGDDHLYVKGSDTITIDGSQQLYIKKAQNIKVEGNVNMSIGGNMNVGAGKNINLTAGDEIVLKGKAIRLN